MHADLVGAAGLEVDLEQAGVRERLEGLVVRDARLAAGDDGPAVVGRRVTVDRGVDRALEGIGVALDHREVHLLDGAPRERPLDRRGRSRSDCR